MVQALVKPQYVLVELDNSWYNKMALSLVKLHTMLCYNVKILCYNVKILCYNVIGTDLVFQSGLGFG